MSDAYTRNMQELAEIEARQRARAEKEMLDKEVDQAIDVMQLKDMLAGKKVKQMSKDLKNRRKDSQWEAYLSQLRMRSVPSPTPTIPPYLVGNPEGKGAYIRDALNNERVRRIQEKNAPKPSALESMLEMLKESPEYFQQDPSLMHKGF